MFLLLLLPPSARAFKVPSGIGAPSAAATTYSATQTARNLADAAYIASNNRTATVSFGARDVSERPLNLDFVPRIGWKGTVFPSVASPVLCSVVASAVALYIHDRLGFAGIDATAHTILGVLTSFLTVFRTQQAYGRYWEGRGHLGTIMASVVETASIASIHFSGEQPERAAAARLELGRLLRVYFRETVRFLRKTSRTTQRVSNYWLPEDATNRADLDAAPECDLEASPGECTALSAVPRPPNLVLQWIRAWVYRVGVEQELVAGADAAARTRTLSLGVDRALSQLQPAFNGAAKIATTPAPQPYTQMSRWLAFWFCFTVPLALVRAFAVPGGQPVGVVPAAALLAFGYYGLDYCSNQLQNPFIAEFGDVSLDGRFMQAVCEDVDMLLLPGEETRAARAAATEAGE